MVFHSLNKPARGITRVVIDHELILVGIEAGCCFSYTLRVAFTCVWPFGFHLVSVADKADERPSLPQAVKAMTRMKENLPKMMRIATVMMTKINGPMTRSVPIVMMGATS